MLRAQTIICTLCVLGIVTGCGISGSSWPAAQGGGMAEWTTATSDSNSLEDIGVALYQRLDLVEAEYERLLASGGAHAVAADMSVLERNLIVIRREITGRLYAEAEKKLFSAEIKLSDMKIKTDAFRGENELKGQIVSFEL